MATAAAAFAATRTHSRLWSIAIFAADAVCIAVAAAVAVKYHYHNIPLPLLAAACTAVLAVLALSGTYRRSFGGTMRDEWYAVAAAFALVLVPLLIATFFSTALWYARPEAAVFAAIGFAGIATTRAIVHRTRVPRRLAIVGIPERIDIALVHLRPRRDDVLLRLPVGNIDGSFDETGGPPWLRGALAWGAARIIITEALPPERLMRVFELAARHGATIAIAPPRLRPHAFKLGIERDGGLTLLCPRPLPVCTRWAAIYKRTLDLALTVPALIACSPLMAACALAIKLDSAGPVIYRQTRVGKNGKDFEMLKFRSMPVDIEAQSGPIWADPSVPRATRVGRVLRRMSLDELPQLVNVVRGEMSLVGPRPERPYFVDRFRRTVPRYDERHLVSPGITGWSQISMSRVLMTDDVSVKLEGDLFYLEEWSPLLDAQIIVKTAFEFLFQRVA